MPSKKSREATYYEVEVKLRVDDRKAMLRRLGKRKARLEVPRTHEMNTLYDAPDGLLMRKGQMLRIRVERRAPSAGGRRKPGPRANEKSGDLRKGLRRAVLTYKGPVQDAGEESAKAGTANSYKIRQERELVIADPAAMIAILEALGLRAVFRYEKYRSTYRLPRTGDVKVELDETPAGNFLELEGTPKAIDRAAALLGYAPADYITKSYGALWMELRGTPFEGETRTGKRSVAADDMLF